MWRNSKLQGNLILLKASDHNIGHCILDVLATRQLALDEARHVLNLGVGS